MSDKSSFFISFAAFLFSFVCTFVLSDVQPTTPELFMKMLFRMIGLSMLLCVQFWLVYWMFRPKQ